MRGCGGARLALARVCINSDAGQRQRVPRTLAPSRVRTSRTSRTPAPPHPRTVECPVAVSPGFLAFVLEQLEGLGNVTSRRMFGGAGLYRGDVFFAVLDNDTLFFKVNETTVGPYQQAGMSPFQPYPGKPETSFGYYQVPVGVLEDRDELVAWARTAVDVGRAKAGSRRRRNPRSRRRV